MIPNTPDAHMNEKPYNTKTLTIYNIHTFTKQFCASRIIYEYIKSHTKLISQQENIRKRKVMDKSIQLNMF